MCDSIVIRVRPDLDLPCEVEIDSSGHFVIDVHAGLRHAHMVDLISQLIGDVCVACGPDTHRRAVEALCAASSVPLADTA